MLFKNTSINQLTKFGVQCQNPSQQAGSLRPGRLPNRSTTDAIATTSAAAKKLGIPVIFFNTDDEASGRYAYVGANLHEAGVIWAKYLVDNTLVREWVMAWMLATNSDRI